MIHVTLLGIPNPDRTSWTKSPTTTTQQQLYAVGICESVSHINHLGVRMKIVKMDRRFSLYHEGFTHQIRNFRVTPDNELRELESYFIKKYGYSSEFVFYHGISQREYNTHWRMERAKRRFTGGTKIYVKNEQDLLWLALKFNAQIG